MGKRDTIAFKLQVLQPILKGKMSIREAAHFYNIPSLYLILDLFNNEIVSYTLSYRQILAEHGIIQSMSRKGKFG